MSFRGSPLVIILCVLILATIASVVVYAKTTQFGTVAEDIAYFFGKVGIGTTLPAEKLEVSGNIKLSGESPTYKVTNLATPVDNSDAATKGYVLSQIEGASSGGWDLTTAWTYIGNSTATDGGVVSVGQVASNSSELILCITQNQSEANVITYAAPPAGVPSPTISIVHNCKAASYLTFGQIAATGGATASTSLLSTTQAGSTYQLSAATYVCGGAATDTYQAMISPSRCLYLIVTRASATPCYAPAIRLFAWERAI